MNCLTASFEFEHGAMSAEIIREWSSEARIVREFTCYAGFVCGTGLNVDEDVLWASDGILLTVDGGKIYITRQ